MASTRSVARSPRASIARATWLVHPGRPGPRASLLRQSQWWPTGRLEALQLESLRALVEAARSNAWWRDRLDRAGIGSRSLGSIEAIRALPPLERGELQERGVAGLRTPGGRGLTMATSGSVGAPVRAIWSREMIGWFEADDRRCWEWLGVGPGERRLWIAASASSSSLRRRLSTHLTNVVVARSALLEDEAFAQALIDDLDRRPVRGVWGQSTGLYALALALRKHGRRLAVPACWSEGNYLFPAHREVIEDALRCRVLERYGAWEAGMIAHQCPEEGRFHVSAENVLLEIVDGAGRPAAPGEEGEILLTPLHNRAMPLLRYRIGDRAIAPHEECGCGRGLPLLGRLVGRSNDLLHTAAGRVVPPGEVSAVMTKRVASVVQFQVVQQRDLSVDVSVVQRDDPLASRHRAEIATALDGLLQVPGATRVERVSHIPLTASGKLRHVVSLAGPPEFES